MEMKRIDRRAAAKLSSPGELFDLPLWSQAIMVRSGEITSGQLVELYLDRIKRFDGRDGLNAFITLAADTALKEAGRLDRLARKKEFKGPLHGLPIAIKDNLDTKGIRTTGGTSILADWHPASDAHVVKKLKDAGAIIIGKTNMHELAFGITNNNPHYGPARNPYDPTRIPGGSSGGSAIATAAGLCSGSIGSDTGGSVRIPAALCGVVGLKPTVGRVGRGGLMCLSFTRDVVGPITRTVRDAALIMEVISGPDPRDSECVSRPVPRYTASLKSSLKGMRFGIPRNFFLDLVHSETLKVFDEAVREIRKMGGTVKEVRVAGTELYPTAINMVLSECIYLIEEYLQAFDPEATIDKYLDQLGPDVQGFLGMQKGRPDSRPVPGYVYVKTVRENRRKMIAGFEAAIAGVDALLTPTTIMPAARIGEDAETTLEGKSVPTFSAFTRTVNPFNVFGSPAITVPAGYSRRGLPIGLQIAARWWEEGKLLAIAHAFEQETQVRKAPTL
jgi:aspartyl-tRNA(Asn)/glutamyl-tRNA(Gln) amidotransferase subunit A